MNVSAQELQASAIVERMMASDDFSRWMNIELLTVRHGYVKLRCRIRAGMTNGFDVTHGGVIFSLADSALAFAASSTGRKAFTAESSITFLKRSAAGDIITAETECVHAGKRTGHYLVHVHNENHEAVALFKGMVMFSDG